MLGAAGPQRARGRGSSHLTEHREFEDGEIIPGTRYRVLRLIGVGGMGSVYEVEHVELGKRFVLKALLRELARREDLAQRLRNEWRALARLQHENIVNVTDAGTSGSGVPYYVMERLDGDTLATVLRNRRRLHVLEAVAVATAVLDALSAAHDIGVIHRDVKPANIFMVKGGGVKLLDFGIAKIADATSVVTARGLAVGTPRYMSPEQARGERVDGRSDVYATALILFEMIAGVGPFDDARDANELLLAHLAREAPPLSSLVMGVSPELERILVSMLAKDCRARPAHAREVARQLREFALRQRSAPATDAPTAQARYGPNTLAAAQRVTPSPLHSQITRPDGPGRPRPERNGPTPTPSDVALTRRMELSGDLRSALAASGAGPTTETTLTARSLPAFELSSVPDTTFVSQPAFDGSTTLEMSGISSASGRAFLGQALPVANTASAVERPERTEMLGEFTPPPALDAVPTRTKVPLPERPISVTPPPVVDASRSQLKAPSRRLSGRLVISALFGVVLVGGFAARTLRHSRGGAETSAVPPAPVAAASHRTIEVTEVAQPAEQPAPAAPIGSGPASSPPLQVRASSNTLTPEVIKESAPRTGQSLRQLDPESLSVRPPASAAPAGEVLSRVPARRPAAPAKPRPAFGLPGSGL